MEWTERRRDGWTNGTDELFPPAPGLRLLFQLKSTEEHHRRQAGTKLYCLVTGAHAREQLAQGCYLEADRPRFEPATFWVASERSTATPRTQATRSRVPTGFVVVSNVDARLAALY